MKNLARDYVIGLFNREPESLLEEETEEVLKEYAECGDVSITVLT